MSLDEVKQIPTWFVWLALMAMIALLVWALKYIFDRNKEDWSEVKSAMKELISIQKIHTYRIDENSNDIKDLQSQIMHLNGAPEVKYRK